MASAEQRKPEAVRREIESERERLAQAVDSLRDAAKIRVSPPVLAAAALGAGFVPEAGKARRRRAWAGLRSSIATRPSVSPSASRPLKLPKGGGLKGEPLVPL